MVSSQREPPRLDGTATADTEGVEGRIQRSFDTPSCWDAGARRGAATEEGWSWLRAAAMGMMSIMPTRPMWDCSATANSTDTFWYCHRAGGDIQFLMHHWTKALA